MKRPPICYWDSCVFLSWLAGCKDRRDPRDKGNLDNVVRLIVEKKVNMITSALTVAEVLFGAGKDAKASQFEDLLKRSNTSRVETGSRIWKLAHDLREYYRPENTKEELPTLTVPDAVHLATAILNETDEFHTFDERDVTFKEATARRPTKRGLIPLSGNVMGHKLTICKPATAQLALLHGDHEEDMSQLFE